MSVGETLGGLRRKASLEDIATVIMGQSPPSSAYNTDGIGLPFFQGKAEFGSMHPTPVKWCSAPTKIAEPGDVLISVRAPVGPTNLAIDRCCIGRGLAAIRARPGYRSKWLLYAFRTMEGAIENLGTGTTFKAISGETLRHLEIPLADLECQDRTIAEIEKQFSRLDEAAASLERVKGALSRYRASALSEAARSPYGRWPDCRLSDLFSEPIVNGLSVKESPTPTAVRALRLSAMSDSGLNYADHRYLPVDPQTVEDIVVRNGDFFVSRGNGSLALVGRGTIAQIPPFPVIFPDTMMRLRFADPSVREWVEMLWPSRLVRRQIERRVKTTAGIYKISQPQVASITVPLPSLRSASASSPKSIAACQSSARSKRKSWRT
ncbi:MAG: restriction endonuclease subunit S [Burkholderiaceae bacterium]|nr:restriction endonuclease subunit S [Burkholderiaceae bacterium]